LLFELALITLEGKCKAISSPNWGTGAPPISAIPAKKRIAFLIKLLNISIALLTKVLHRSGILEIHSEYLTI
jgi:hypothetical protein